LEIRQNVRRVSTGPFVFVVAVLIVLAVALVAWYVASTTIAPLRSDRGRPTVTTGFIAPDAAERNAQLQTAQLSKAEATHGH
jgi:hypothetical protein